MKNFGRWMVLLILVIVVVSIYYFDVLSLFTSDNINEFIDMWGSQVNENRIVFSLIGIGLYAVVAMLALPISTIVTLSMGFLFGFINGVVVVVLGATLGASINFILTRYLIGDSIQKRYGERIAKVNQEIEENGSNYLLTLRLIPIFPFFLINIASGLSKVKFSTFFVTTLLGIVPGTAAYVYLGTSLTDFTDGTPGVPTNVLIAFVILGLFALLPVVYKKYKRQAN